MRRWLPNLDRPSGKIFLAVLMGLAGCGDGRGPVHLVYGKLMVDGVPAANASLAFHPLGSTDPIAPRAVGTTNPDGSFHLTTFVSDDGAPAGDYVVTVIWHDLSKPIDECGCEDLTVHDLFRGADADAAHSSLRATIRPGLNNIKVEAPAPPTLPGPMDEANRVDGAGAIFGKLPRSREELSE